MNRLKLMQFEFSRIEIVAFAFILLTTCFLYFDMFSFWAYRDELRHLAHAHRVIDTSEFKYFLGIKPWLRPLEVLVNYANVQLVGFEATYISHAVSLLAFLSCISLVFYIAKKFSVGPTYFPLIASALFAFHPVNVASIYRIDTMSQQFVTLFALIFIVLLAKTKTISEKKVIFISSVLAVLLLLSKETSLGLVAAIPFVSYIIRTAHVSDIPLRLMPELRSFFIIWFIVLIILFIYVILRQDYVSNVMQNSATRYHVEFSIIGVIKNTIFSLSSLFYFGNTIDVFDGFKTDKVAITVFFSVFVMGLCFIGLWAIIKQKQIACIKIIIALSLLVLSGVFPAVLIEKVNELYSYGSSPFSSFLVALLACEGYKVVNLKYRTLSMIIPILFVLLCSWMALGIVDKMNHAKVVNNRAKFMYSNIMMWINSSNRTEYLCFDNFDPPQDKSYNMFLSPDADLMSSVILYVRSATNKNITMEVNKGADSCAYRVVEIFKS